MAVLSDFLPSDWRTARLLGRVQGPEGPTPVLLRDGRIRDVSRLAPTTADALANPARLVEADGPVLGDIDDAVFTACWEDAPSDQALKLLSPLDLQCVKASGVTFAVSALERVIEERARGRADAAAEIRRALAARIGSDLSSVRPGSPEAETLKAALIEDGLWSQYLEVAIGKDAEIFTKAPVLASVGLGDWVGVRDDAVWTNPEPEVVLVCDASGRAVGAALGNDVNLRCIEGRSALLLGKAKDNNASASVGPFIRVFDGVFTLDDVRSATVSLQVTGDDGFEMTGSSSMSLISRDPAELAAQTCGSQHQYPDGFALYLGTMFAPIEDRDEPGKGFTHKPGDRVRVASERLGVLENEVTTCDQAPPWTFGVSALMRNLAGRGLIGAMA